MPLPLKSSEGKWPAGILQFVLDVWDIPETGPSLRRILLAALSDTVQCRSLAEFVERELVEELASRLESLRATRRATAIMRMILSRYVLVASPLRDLSQREIITTLGPLLHTAL